MYRRQRHQQLSLARTHRRLKVNPHGGGGGTRRPRQTRPGRVAVPGKDAPGAPAHLARSPPPPAAEPAATRSYLSAVSPLLPRLHTRPRPQPSAEGETRRPERPRPRRASRAAAHPAGPRHRPAGAAREAPAGWPGAACSPRCGSAV